MDDHEKLVKAIHTISLTRLPDLLYRVVRLCVQQGVFQPGGLELLVERAKQSAMEECDVRKTAAEKRIEADGEQELTQKQATEFIQLIVDSAAAAEQHARKMRTIADRITREKLTLEGVKEALWQLPVFNDPSAEQIENWMQRIYS